MCFFEFGRVLCFDAKTGTLNTMADNQVHLTERLSANVIPR